jgi:hypothetical protein
LNFGTGKIVLSPTLIPGVMMSYLPGVLIGYELHRIAAGEETALQQILKDGIVCCRIVNCIIPNKIPKVNTLIIELSSTLDNINQ